ncbi:hypothetical protein UFOVP118_49 [uncultured Caudovirales phage]|uniref:Uncharacterized protein n=1 Tax=uncultured Caudovirales phage TaxID=2100421 RepID=A0A6J5L7S3_9CAUD|nr:hypothetical protein UFOVP118_49 [uncultured Caudovirales phage]
MGFLGWITLLFIALKLTHYIDWSWWLILFPIYGIFGIFTILFILARIFKD